MTLYDFFLNIYLSKGNNKEEVKSKYKIQYDKILFFDDFFKDLFPEGKKDYIKLIKHLVDLSKFFQKEKNSNKKNIFVIKEKEKNNNSSTYISNKINRSSSKSELSHLSENYENLYSIIFPQKNFKTTIIHSTLTTKVI